MIVISFFLPSTFHIERKVEINADKEIIFEQVNELKNWGNWTVWAQIDQGVYVIEDSYSDPSNGVGAKFIWDSENDDLGKGSLEILESTPNSYLKHNTSIGFIESINEWSFNEVDEGVEVVWSMDVEFGFNPLSKFMGLFMEDHVGPDFEKSLERLKLFSENLPKIKKVVVEKEVMEKDLWFLSIRDTVNQMEMSNVHGKIYATINKYLDEQEVETNSPPLVIYHFFSDTLIDIELGIPVSDSAIHDQGRIKLNKMNAGNFVTATHYGPYDRLPETYFGINEWMRKNKVLVLGPPWESYITDPATEPNPEKWQTAIYFPIE